MADYYSRLEAQLTELTAHGAHRPRRRFGIRLPKRMVGVQAVALAVSALIVVAVAAAFLGAGAGRRRPHSSTATPQGREAVLHNSYAARLPAPPGALVCDASLNAPRGQRSGHGVVRFYARPPTRVEMFLTVSGLSPIRSGDRYAVWVLPAVSTVSGGYQPVHSGTPELLGIVEPSPGPSGRLSVASTLPRALNGAYEVVVTIQRRSSVRRLGAIALDGFVGF